MAKKKKSKMANATCNIYEGKFDIAYYCLIDSTSCAHALYEVMPPEPDDQCGFAEITAELERLKEEENDAE